MNKLKISPTSNLLKGLFACTLIALVFSLLKAFVFPEILFLTQGAYVVSGLFITIAMFDAFADYKGPAIEIERSLPNNLALGKWIDVELKLVHSGGSNGVGNKSYKALEVYDFHPPSCLTDTLPIEVEIKPDVSSTIKYKLRPIQRGMVVFSGVEVRWPSPVGLWKRKRFITCESHRKVYPNFKMLAGYALLAVDNHTSQLGIKRRPRRGEGLEFHQLREYRLGDTMRQVDWKATSRHNKLISKEYADERDQQIVIMLDNGRRMLAQDDELNHFDHALNASLMLAYVGLRQGDSVGVLSFGNNDRWLAPVKGAVNVPRILNHVYDIHAGKTASDYLQASQTLISRQNKRSLVILVTNLRDENMDDLIASAKLMQRKHLVLVANIREQVLDDVLAEPVQDFEQAINYTSTVNYIKQRTSIHKQLIENGIFAIDCLPKELMTRVINSYLEIKRAGFL